MWTPERLYPLGFPGRQALQLTLGGLGVAFAIGYFRFLASYYNKFGQESRAASPAFPPSRA